MIRDPRTTPDRRTGELDWLLDDLVLRVSEVRHAVVLSNDGLAVGASTGLGRVEYAGRMHTVRLLDSVR